jgi:hypothetical protein
MTADAAPRRLLDGFCRKPDPFDTIEQYQRFHHFDVERLSLAELLLERDRVKQRLLLDARPDRWFLDRLRVLQERLADAR